MISLRVLTIACFVIAAVPTSAFAQRVCEGTCLEVKRQMNEADRARANPVYTTPSTTSQPSIGEQFKQTEREWQELERRQRASDEETRRWVGAQEQRRADAASIPTTPQGLYDKGMEYYQAGNCPMAARLWTDAADMGHAQAMYWLAISYETDQCGVPKDLNKAPALYTLAEVQGYELAQMGRERLEEKMRNSN